MLCYPDLPDSFHTRTRGHQIEPAVVRFKTFIYPFFLTPSLQKVVLCTANAHLLENAEEATGLQGFKQRHERSMEENPTEVSQQPRPHPAQEVSGPQGLEDWERVSGISITTASFTVPRHPLMAIDLNQYGLYST